LGKNEEETYFPWFEVMGKCYEETKITLDELTKIFADDKTNTEEEVEERNDVYIYKTLRYPPKSIPPTAT
jgi:hypothetical protein